MIDRCNQNRGGDVKSGSQLTIPRYGNIPLISHTAWKRRQVIGRTAAFWEL